jgi:hypothetical protein
MSSMPTVEEVRAFVGGPSADYYLKAWGPALEGRGRAGGFNSAAFFLTGLWLPFRKMYGVALLVYGLLLAEIAVEYAVLRAVRGAEGEAAGVQAGMTCFVTLVLAVVAGAYGNAWYLAHARRVIAEVRAKGLPEERHLKALTRRGGTSLFSALALAGAFVLAQALLMSALSP